ncbi:Oligopeptide transport ATP-binding protein AppF [Geodia barretti]|uniref:Oligopeptide transport ATP-binding protein AppF n=1 Tax=Geodia barretti TaxID=519541 RepID=A0AA35SHM0_GEOBA|nr:Oligopeptide transport ATP-binding protein AppF [Geodia barretti]
MFRPNPLTIKANAELVLEVIDLSVRYQTRQGEVQAVEGVSFELGQGQSLGLVGESGCGKTSVANSLMGLLPENARLAGGQIRLGGTDLLRLSDEEMRRYRWRRIAMVFQDPYESMNPRRTIYDTIAEPLAVQGIGSLMDRVDRVTEILTQVGLTPASSFLFRHPHELSGGQRQRVAIARALVIGPSFVVADEPTSMLDVSSRTGIMLLMQELAARLGIAYLYITHDLAVARYMCHRIAVMYLGKIIELAETEELLRNPLHPYTRALLSAVPVPDPTYRRDRPDIRGDLTLPIDPPARCRFYDRCPIGTDFCRDNPHPPMEERAAGHWVACYEA